MDRQEQEEKRRWVREDYRKRRDESSPQELAAWRAKQRAANAASYAKHRGKRLAAHRARLKADKVRVAEYFRRYRETNRERLRAYGEAYRKEHADRINAANKRWRERNPGYKWTPGQRKQVAARRIIRLATSEGLVQKPVNCERCGRPFPGNRLHGHHHKGYDHPLEVQWLCAKCHGKAHRKD